MLENGGRFEWETTWTSKNVLRHPRYFRYICWYNYECLRLDANMQTILNLNRRHSSYFRLHKPGACACIYQEASVIWSQCDLVTNTPRRRLNVKLEVKDNEKSQKFFLQKTLLGIKFERFIQSAVFKLQWDSRNRRQVLWRCNQNVFLLRILCSSVYPSGVHFLLMV